MRVPTLGGLCVQLGRVDAQTITLNGLPIEAIHEHTATWPARQVVIVRTAHGLFVIAESEYRRALACLNSTDDFSLCEQHHLRVAKKPLLERAVVAGA